MGARRAWTGEATELAAPALHTAPVGVSRCHCRHRQRRCIRATDPAGLRRDQLCPAPAPLRCCAHAQAVGIPRGQRHSHGHHHRSAADGLWGGGPIVQASRARPAPRAPGSRCQARGRSSPTALCPQDCSQAQIGSRDCRCLPGYGWSGDLCSQASPCGGLDSSLAPCSCLRWTSSSTRYCQPPPPGTGELPQPRAPWAGGLRAKGFPDLPADQGLTCGFSFQMHLTPRWHPRQLQQGAPSPSQ